MAHRCEIADDIFGLTPRWIESFAEEVAARDARIPFTIQSRVDLMTPSAVAALAHAGAPADAGFLSRALLEAGDRVKFARVDAGPADCRAAVEEAYRLVDLTKPVEVPVEAGAVEAAR